MGCAGSKGAEVADKPKAAKDTKDGKGAMNKLALSDVDVKGKRVLMRSVPSCGLARQAEWRGGGVPPVLLGYALCVVPGERGSGNLRPIGAEAVAGARC